MHSEFGAMRMDALTEVFNVIMGAASTATASMLDAKTSFTVKTSELYKNTDLKFHKMDPSVLVKIDYFKGVTGFFYLLFKQDDLQLMLNQLMGMPPKIDGSFTFDDVNLSAVTEIVNLFMGAATTSLAQMVNTPVEIATPETTVNELGSTVVYSGLGASDDTACVLNLKLEVEGIVTSEFYVILSMELARGIADKIMGTEDVPEPPPPVPVTPAVNTENDFGIEFDDIKKDAIGEVNNITMGAAATAISNLLDAKVWITTPSVSLSNTSVLSFPALEPSVQVKIEYIKGISGSSLLVLKQRDVQLILNQLMGQPLVVTDDFEFNELNISAVCEVMNQMMGASATALSKLIDTSIDISTPIAQVHDITKGKDEKIKYGDLGPNEDVCVVSFNLTIDDVVESEFISVLSIDLANEIAEKMLAHYNSSMAAAMDFVEEAQNVPASQTPPPNIRYAQPEQPQYVSQSGYVPPQYSPQQQYAQPPEEMQQRAPQQPYYAPPQEGAQQYASQQPYYAPPQEGAQPYVHPQPYVSAPGYAPMPPQENAAMTPQTFLSRNSSLTREQTDNLKLLMNVPMSVSIEIGSARRKVKDILDFNQGTVLELDKLADDPVDIIVNGHLIARGDVVVLDDNFAIKVAEIVDSDLLDSLGN